MAWQSQPRERDWDKEKQAHRPKKGQHLRKRHNHKQKLPKQQRSTTHEKWTREMKIQKKKAFKSSQGEIEFCFCVNNKPGSTNFNIKPPMWRSPRTRNVFSTCRSVMKIRKFHVLSPTWIILMTNCCFVRLLSLLLLLLLWIMIVVVIRITQTQHFFI